jgi:hypothetical protein
MTVPVFVGAIRCLTFTATCGRPEPSKFNLTTGLESVLRSYCAGRWTSLPGRAAMQDDEIIRNMFTDPAVKPLSTYGLFAATKGDRRIGMAVAYRSQNDRSSDYALNKDRFDRLQKGLVEKKIDESYVVLLQRNSSSRPEVLDWRTVEQMEPLLAKLQLREGQFGSYWWIPANFQDPDIEVF